MDLQSFASFACLAVSQLKLSLYFPLSRPRTVAMSHGGAINALPTGVFLEQLGQLHKPSVMALAAAARRWSGPARLVIRPWLVERSRADLVISCEGRTAALGFKDGTVHGFSPQLFPAAKLQPEDAVQMLAFLVDILRRDLRPLAQEVLSCTPGAHAEVVWEPFVDIVFAPSTHTPKVSRLNRFVSAAFASTVLSQPPPPQPTFLPGDRRDVLVLVERRRGAHQPLTRRGLLAGHRGGCVRRDLYRGHGHLRCREQ